MDTNEPRLPVCADCMHLARNQRPVAAHRMWLCRHPDSDRNPPSAGRGYDLVTGEDLPILRPSWRPAREMRGSEKLCGRVAKMFEPAGRGDGEAG